MHWLKRFLIGAAVACALPACAGVVSAQVPRSGYIFAEVTNSNDQPVSGAAAVVYNEKGDEVGSSVSDAGGRVSLMMNRRQPERFIFRIFKSGYLTYEGVFETSGEYRNTEIKVKLISTPKSKASAARRASPSLQLVPMPDEHSPPSDSRPRRDAARASPATALRGPPK